MAAGSIYTDKELRSGYQPLVLLVITLTDGTVYRYSTHNLTGSNQYGGYDWEPRIMNAPIAAMQALSDNGSEIPPTMDITLNDADGGVSSYIISTGLMGAQVRALFLFYDVIGGTFSTDFRVMFLGRANNPTSMDNLSVTFTAENALNMQNKSVPGAHVQKLCMNDFPTTSAERIIASGPFDGTGLRRCRYSVDVPTIGIGNNDPGTGLPYTACGFSYGDCMARMGNGSRVDIDGSGRPTGTFNGIRYQPQVSYTSRGYISGNWVFGINNQNLGKYALPIPLAYGNVEATAPTVVTFGDANLTGIEVLVSFDQVIAMTTVIVNGVTILRSGVGGSTIAGFWDILNDGSPLGHTNPDTGNQGDSYGSIAVLRIKVPKALFDSAGEADVKVQLTGKKVRVYSAGSPLTVAGVADGPPAVLHIVAHGLTNGQPVQNSGFNGNTTLNGQYTVTVVDADHVSLDNSLKVGAWTSGGTVTPWTFTYQFSSTPMWVTLDLAWQADLDYTSIKLAAAVTEAAYSSSFIAYTDLWGSAGSHPRFSVSYFINQQRGAAEVIRAIRKGFRCYLVQSEQGLLEPRIRKTLAEQQPAAVLGSNSVTPISSVLSDGTSAVGYSAYDFDDSNIARQGGSANNPPSLRFLYRSKQQSPNVLSCSIQDVENQNSADSLTQKCLPAYQVMKEVISSQFAAEGVNTYDQANRLFNVEFSETFLGNLTTDFTGTVGIEWQAGTWALHLSVGDIVRVGSASRNLPQVQVRITKKVPNTNCQLFTLSGTFHDDTWYRDDYEQNPGSGASTLADAKLIRPPYAIRGNITSPAATDSMFSASEAFFGITLGYATDAAGAPIPQLEVTFDDPPNILATSPVPPYLPQQGTTATTGGTIKGGIPVFIAIAAKDTIGATYKVTPASTICVTYVPAGTNTNTVTVSGIKYPATTIGIVILAGTDPQAMTIQSISDTTPGSITLTSLIVGSNGPDQRFSSAIVRVWLGIHLGTVGAKISGVTSTTMTVANIYWDVNQWNNCDVSVIGFSADPAEAPIANFGIASNTSDTLTLSAGNPLSLGVQAGDIIIIRSRPTGWSTNWYEDSNWNNSTALLVTWDLVAAPSGSHIQVTRTAHGLSTGAKVRIDNGVDLNGIWAITVVDANHFTLNGSGSSTAYVSGGLISPLSGGLIPSAERGNLLVAISGTGRGMWNKIADNSGIRTTIEGSWAVTPDSSTRFVILAPNPVSNEPASPLPSATIGTATTVTVKVPNYKNEPLVVGVVAVAEDGKEALQYLTHLREIYSFGATEEIGQKTISTTPYNMDPSDEALTFVTGSSVANLPSLTSLGRRTRWFLNDPSNSSSVTINCTGSDELPNGLTSKVLTPGAFYQLIPNV